MAGVDFVFNIALGRVNGYADRVESGDPSTARLTVVVLESTGLEADGTLKNYDTLALLLAGGSSEPEQAQYARKTIAAANMAVTVTDGSDKAELDVDDQTWSAVVAGDAWSKIVVCYNPTAGADSTLIPLVGLDIDVVPDGNDITWQPNASGIFRATDTSA